MTLAAIGLGANLGDRAAALRSALASLEPFGAVVARSGIWETEPRDHLEQPEFLNAVLLLESERSPRELLATCLDIEARHGRRRETPRGPRTLDLDLLFVDDVVLVEPDLVLPHPRLADRRFVLAPLAEVAPGWRHPVTGLTVRELLDRCPDAGRVHRTELPLAPVPAPER